MDKKTRTIYFYDISVSTHVIYDKIENPSQETIANCLAAITKSKPKGKHYSYQNGTLHYEIADWNFNIATNQYTVLINKSDSNSADPTFSNIPKKTRRIVNKITGEGLDLSSHLIIQIDPKKPHSALLLLEKSALAGSGHIENIFHRLLSDCKTAQPTFFQQNHPSGIKDKDGEFVKIKVRHEFIVEGHLSSSFAKDLEAGSLSDVLLISENDADMPMDANGRFLKKNRTETVVINPKKQFSIDSLKAFLKGESETFEKARVRFRGKDQVNRDIEIDTKTFSEVNYVKRAKLDFLFDLPSSSEIENKDITDEMKKLI